jgi:protein-tyrosine phosphatase
MIEQSHLVLGATPRHRSAVVGHTPTALRTAFGIREFARLAASVDPAPLPSAPVARAHMLVELALQRRGLTPPVSPTEDDVPDPMDRPTQAHRAAGRLIREAVHTIVDIIAPPGPHTR